jgi:purine-binding chemotaxis protein CheW
MKTNKTGKSEVHLIFRLGKDFFGIPISKAFNILEISRMTSIKNSNDLILGNVSIRGSLVPIVNLHSKFGKKLDDYTYNNSLLVVETNNNGKLLIGILIDALLEVTEIKINDIDFDTKKMNTGYNGSVKGYYKRNKQINIGILDLENIFTLDEISLLKKSAI